MIDLIKSISQTPLPTILVIAGILFIFLGIGGQLGAQIVTDSIKRKFSGILGAMLLISGFSLYCAGQPPDVVDVVQSFPVFMINEESLPPKSEGVPEYDETQIQYECVVDNTTLLIDRDGNVSPSGHARASSHPRCEFDIIGPDQISYCVNQEDGAVLLTDERGWYSVGRCREV
jgi:hypothetical protein